MIKFSASLLIPFVVFAALVIAGCEAGEIASVELTGTESSTEAAITGKYGAEDGMVVVPFKARFRTTAQASGEYRESCGARPAPRFNQAIQKGSGQATHLGNFSAYGTFCMDILAFFNDGLLTAGETAPYDNGWFVLTAANGDELWFSIEGEVLPSDDPQYAGEFFSPFYVEGGTGRFEGASGEGTTKNYILPGFPTEVIHEWEGVLVLPKGN